MYILLDKENRVSEVIHDFDPTFPDIPIEDRYSAEFIKKLKHFPEDTIVEQNWEYDPDTDTFAPTEEDELNGEEPVETATPTLGQQLRADIDFIAAMTGVDL